MDIINTVPAARRQPARSSLRSVVSRYFTKEVRLAVVLIGFPCLGWYVASARVARHHYTVNQQARREARESRKRLQAIQDEKKKTLTGYGFRWFPTHDVTGATIPHPGTGKPTLVVFGANSEPMLSAPAWKQILDQHPKAVMLAVMQGKAERVRSSAGKIKQHERVFLIADPNHLLHGMFNATHRAFVISGSGKVLWHDEPVGGWKPSKEVVEAIDSRLRKAGA